MGNHLYRPHHARFAAAAMRARINKENSVGKEENTVTLFQKTLYNTGISGFYLSFSDYKSTSTPKTIETSLSVHRDSVKLVKDSDSELYGLTFVCDSKQDLQIAVYFYVKEIIDTKTKAQYLSLDKVKSPSPAVLAVKKGFSQEIITSPVFNMKNFSNSELSFEDHRTFPIVLFMKTQKESLLMYFKIEGDNIVKIRESYSVGDKNYEVYELYGNNTGECAVCFADCKRKVLFPCRHVCVCQDCLDNIIKRDHKCPICRSYIRGGYNLHG